ncbi:MAG: two component transcriptional regulator, LuxR family [Devosia sp.]|uniref:response regulator n=1 Tax=Devosia sp. TaxID=1871048 RepID=UPI00260DA367|nr:response regulator transcription factor [Devosia sp.]MDB5540936.1 two component transcriptional regulator, LuxR family [Devosia sp.]
MHQTRVSVALVDDHPVLLEGMRALFARQPAFRVVATGVSASDALSIAETHRPDILFLDLSMPGDVFAAIAEIARRFHPTKVIIFTAFASVDSATRALEAGAAGFVLKGALASELFDAIAHVRRGEMFITHQYASQVLVGLRSRAPREAVNGALKLNLREKQIVGHLLQARTNREIASSLSISEQTVKRYMTNLMLKLNARSRVDVAVQAQRNGQLD